MLRRHRSVGTLLPILLLLALAGCGGKDSDTNALNTGDKTLTGLDAVKITGTLGSQPTLTWSGQMDADKLSSTTLIKGTGKPLAKGDAVLAQIVIANGFTKQVAFSTYDKDTTTGAVMGPQSLTVGTQLGPLFEKAISGALIGSRVAVTGSATEAFGASGQPQLSIGNQDSVLAIVDIMSPILKGPSGDQTPAPSWMPKLTFAKSGAPSGFNFSATAAPKGQFRKAVLLTGTGPVVKSDQTVVVNYLGDVYDGTKPFDQSYDGSPLTKPLSSLIKGWQGGLAGLHVGSRVVLQVPPALGYGKTGNSQAGIKGTDTLFFVIDILAAG